MHPAGISIHDFTYHLPEEKIAAYPLAERDASKLLIYRDGKILTDTYHNITEYLPGNGLLVFNNTRVMEARILFQKSSGGLIEIFCLEPHESYLDISSAMLQTGSVLWKCLIGGASKWKKGLVLEKRSTANSKEICLIANYIEKRPDHFIIELSWTPSSLSFAEMLHQIGSIPLPPYIKRKAEASDAERYQTIYAAAEGSVAAPTAGLHFTDQLFKQMSLKKIQLEFVTLHVGAGTFQPVKSAKIEGHEMHAEFIEVNRSTVERLMKALPAPIIPVGTTSLRTLESLYWMGLKIIKNPDSTREDLSIQQWEAYESDAGDISAHASLAALIGWMDKNKTDNLISKTRLLIAPGYQWKIVHALITNFHQPQSTLLLLVAALLGEEWKAVYDYALKNEFRFLSYGDGCLLFGKSDPNSPFT
ncbi:MAG TPA: S-adenosylmethionine:tRNA ribosyltransferase-isomerase [Puia sp.]|nr:S-adenosylmethionine:tRNA ribosyltransferase-isomerase [Puia sp.]